VLEAKLRGLVLGHGLSMLGVGWCEDITSLGLLCQGSKKGEWWLERPVIFWIVVVARVAGIPLAVESGNSQFECLECYL